MPDTNDIPRREALKVLVVSAAIPALIASCTTAEEGAATAGGARAGASGGATAVPASGPRGTASDPDLLHPKLTWDKVLTKGELVTLAALCDMIIPADAVSTAASTVGAPDYINEWASNPTNTNGLVRVRGGLAWLNLESVRRYSAPFDQLTDAKRTAICDEICYRPNAKPGFESAALFFDTIRDLTATAFYTTPEGMKDLGYLGNVAHKTFEGPSPSILTQIGLA